MKNKITVQSSAQEVVSNLRRAWALKKIILCTSINSEIRNSMLNLPISQYLEAAHVFDFGFFLDEDHKDYLSAEQRFIRPDEVSIMLLPFPYTILMDRLTGDNAGNPSLINVYLLSYMTSNETMAYVFRHSVGNGWVFDGITKIDRLTQSYAGHTTDDSNRAMAVMRHTAIDITLLLCLLGRKGDTVVVNPAVSISTGQPATQGFRKPNPSVGIVRVCTPRVLLTSPSERTGATVIPHDRRSHTRRRGNRIIAVRACKIHGGAKSPVAKSIIIADGSE